MLSDGITAILRISTFEPKNITTYITNIENALMYFENNNAKQIIIDVSQNRGGQICLGYAVFRYFFPNIDPIVGCYDMKASDLLTLYASYAADTLISNLYQIQV